MRLRSILSFKDSSFGPIIARISSSSREWFRAESKLPADALRRDDESSGDRLRRDTRSRLDARRPSDSSRSCWVFVLLFGGNGGGVPEELFSSDKHTFVLRDRVFPRSTAETMIYYLLPPSHITKNECYLSGSGGFGGGLESRKIDSELCELRTKLLLAAVCSRICRSLGVRGISGREFLCASSDPYPEVLTRESSNFNKLFFLIIYDSYYWILLGKKMFQARIA